MNGERNADQARRIRAWLETGRRQGAARVLVILDLVDGTMRPHPVMNRTEYAHVKSELTRSREYAPVEMFDPSRDINEQLARPWTWIPFD